MTNCHKHFQNRYYNVAKCEFSSWNTFFVWVTNNTCNKLAATFPAASIFSHKIFFTLNTGSLTFIHWYFIQWPQTHACIICRVQCLYNINFLQNTLKRHSITCPLRRVMGCIFGGRWWHSSLAYILLVILLVTLLQCCAILDRVITDHDCNKQICV